MLQVKKKFRLNFFNLQLVTRLVETLHPRGAFWHFTDHPPPPSHPPPPKKLKWTIKVLVILSLPSYLVLFDPFAEFSEEKVFLAIFKTTFQGTVKILLWHTFTFCYYLLQANSTLIINLLLTQNNKNLTSTQPRTSTHS